jgi:hypothetical protein
MKRGFQEALDALAKLETSEPLAAKTAKTKTMPHNTNDDLRKGSNPTRIGPAEKPETPKPLTAKTAKTPETSEADELGLVATWSSEFGYVSIHDPTEGVWWDLKTTDAPGWAVSEARKRKELYRGGNRKAYRLTSRAIKEIWESEQPPEEGIVEDPPVEEEGER